MPAPKKPKLDPKQQTLFGLLGQKQPDSNASQSETADGGDLDQYKNSEPTSASSGD